MTKFKALKFRTKLAVGGGVVAATVMAGGAAFAYITGGSGTGTGDATATSSLPTGLTVTVSEPTTLTPGAAASTVTVTIHDTNSYSVHFNGVTVALSGTPSPSAATCGVSLGGTTSYTAGYTATHDTDVVLTATTVSMADDTANDTTSCQGVAFPITATLN